MSELHPTNGDGTEIQTFEGTRSKTSAFYKNGERVLKMESDNVENELTGAVDLGEWR